MLGRELSREKQERWVYLSLRVHTFIYVSSLHSASHVDAHENLKLLHQSDVFGGMQRIRDVREKGVCPS